MKEVPRRLVFMFGFICVLHLDLKMGSGLLENVFSCLEYVLLL